jgi:hypothetical protein
MQKQACRQRSPFHGTPQSRAELFVTVEWEEGHRGRGQEAESRKQKLLEGQGSRLKNCLGVEISIAG